MALESVARSEPTPKITGGVSDDRSDGLAERVRPTSLARDRVLPVLSALAPLLPESGLRRGSTVQLAGGPGSASLALALCAEASQAGSWVSIFGSGALGMAAAAEYGVALERVALVRNADPGDWVQVAGVLVDAADILVFGVPKQLRPSDAARVRARARDRGAVLIPVGAWAESADVRLRTEAGEWEGLVAGGGHLQRRRVDVVVDGRGSAAGGGKHALWLPDADGSVAAVEPVRSPVSEVSDGVVSADMSDFSVEAV